MRAGFGNTYGREPSMLQSNIERVVHRAESVVHGAESVAKVVGTAQTLYQIGKAGIAIAGRLAPLLI